MQKCRICNSKRVTACAASGLNVLFQTSDFTYSACGKLSTGFVRAIFPIAESFLEHIEHFLGIYSLKPAIVTNISSSDDVVLLCRSCGLWFKKDN
ncbi:hypothetical protein HGT73_14180 [Rosenbergiella australiborealis]|uniref:Uncharacterized protein n=1 Tax=Rosenbergiella australiborealis TaxID=1544696 RepID=A0ABS5T7Z1_9GAMM|nr:hypothetical protein [Rosenbergiella australiborealis]MBT0728491.1 hypothetical protein [Rosenbergiella australiborealis]